MAGDSIRATTTCGSDGRDSGLARAILKLAKRGLSVVEELVLLALLVLLFLLLLLILPLLQKQSSRPLVAVRGPPTERRPHLGS